MAKDYYEMSLEGEREQDSYAVKGMHVKATGDYAATAQRAKAGHQDSAIDQMSNGSMDYLAHQKRLIAEDVKKVRRSKAPH